MHCALAGPCASWQGRERADVRAGLVPDFCRRRWQPEHRRGMGKELGGSSYKVHLDGYDQRDFLAGKGPSKRNEILYFAESTLGAVRIGDFKYRFIDQPQGWLGGTVKPDWPILVNLRLDPLERTSLPTQSMNQYSWFAYEFWRFVFAQQVVAQIGESFVQFPPMQKPASFNLEAVKEQIVQAIKSRQGQ
jgi:hypothetical protein